MRYGILLFLFLGFSLNLHAQPEAYVVKQGGTPIVPSEEGDLMVFAQPGTQPRNHQNTYTLVHQHGKPVLMMTPDGHVLTPQEAWHIYGGVAIPSNPSTHVNHKGTLSFPSEGGH